jgi:hypothetical protein
VIPFSALVVASVAGAVGSVTGAVGSVTGAVGSVTGNVGGNVVGSVASVTGNVGGNVTGSVASVVGNVGGNVVGSVASVTGAVGSVTGNIGGNVTGSVGSISGVTFNGTVPNLTQIEGATIATVTNLTNAPTAGDFTAVMKTSLNAATPTAAGISGVTFNGSVPSLAQIEAGTIAGVTLVATTTNLTNAPTVGDLTPTMKASVVTASEAALTAFGASTYAGGDVAGITGVTFNGSVPSLAQIEAGLPSDASIKTDVGDALATYGASTYAGGPVASVTGNVGGNVTGSIGSVIANVTVGAYASGQDPGTLVWGAASRTLSAFTFVLTAAQLANVVAGVKLDASGDGPIWVASGAGGYTLTNPVALGATNTLTQYPDRANADTPVATWNVEVNSQGYITSRVSD